MVKSLAITQDVIFNFYFIKNSPYLKDKVTYGFYFTRTFHKDFTSSSFFINFGKGLIRFEFKKIKDGDIQET